MNYIVVASVCLSIHPSVNNSVHSVSPPSFEIF